MKRDWFRIVIIGLMIAQLAVLAYIARVESQIRTVTALTYVELSSH